jgi:hypothetical protein
MSEIVLQPQDLQTAARKRLVEIAHRDVGQVETSWNQGAWIKKFWPATSYPAGYKNKEPYCAAAVCYWVWQLSQELIADGLLKATTGKTGTQFEAWRCKSARAFGWREWADQKKVLKLGETGRCLPGDVVVFDFSHVGIITGSSERYIHTVEANTNKAGSREGDGCWTKTRPRSAAQCFIRVF